MLVIEWQTPAGMLELLWSLDRARIVVAQNSLATGLVERQGVANAMRIAAARVSAPRLDLDPVAAALVDDGSVQVQQRLQSKLVLLLHCIIR